MTKPAKKRKPESATRPWVDAFADEMEAKLDHNRHKGDRNGWRREGVSEFLLPRLLNEVGELIAALREDEDAVTAQDSKSARAHIRSECADIANFAMMIADVAGDMKPKSSQ